MKTTELRIGNLVNYGLGREPQAITGRDLSEGIEGRPFTPIEITDDWLENMGFEKHGANIFSKQIDNRLRTTIYITDFKVVIGSRNNGMVSFRGDIKYIHQLQNLYYSLTYSELAFNVRQGQLNSKI